MRTLLLFAAITIVFYSCTGLGNKPLSAQERNAIIIKKLQHRADSLALRKNRKSITNLSLQKIDSLTASEYFEYANRIFKKMMDGDKLFIQSEQMSMTTNLSLMKVLKDNPPEYEKARISYEEAKTEMNKLIEEVNKKQRKLDSCERIIQASDNSFWGYHASLTFTVEDSGKTKNGSIAILVSKELQITFL